MSSLSAVTGGGSNWATEVSQAARQAARHVDRAPEHDNNKPEAPAEAGKDTQTSFKQINIKA